MIFFFILIIILLLICFKRTSTSTSIGGSTNEILQRMIPIDSPFLPDFNQHRYKLIKYGYTTYQTQQLFSKIKSSHLTGQYYFDILTALNNDEISIGIMPENILRRAVLNKKIDNFNYVANLFNGYFLFLCSDDLPIRDIQDLTQENCKKMI